MLLRVAAASSYLACACEDFKHLDVCAHAFVDEDLYGFRYLCCALFRCQVEIVQRDQGA